MPHADKTGNRLTAALVAAALLISYPLLFVAAALPSGRHDRMLACWLFLALAVISYLAEVSAPRASPYVANLLNWVQLGLPLRFAFREMALVILLVRARPGSSAEVALFAGGLVGLHAIRGGHSALATYVNQRRVLPVVTRNLDLSELRIPDAPPRLLAVEHTRKLLYLDAAPVAGGLVSALTASMAWALGGVTLALAAGAAGCVIMAVHARRNAHLGNKARILSTVNQQVRTHRPQVVLYFSGARDAVYQVNMWLTTLARLDRPAVIIMRERWMVPLLGRTSLPVVCLDGMVDLLNFPLPSVRVALFPANTAKNLHELRLAGIGHVFIGHGDSDKAASVNPFAKAYDQVWVAGQAGRDRFLRARVGVRDEDIVEVGRPQLAELATQASGRADRMFTVLYAPTWEGWLEDQQHTSLAAMGARIVRALIGCGPQLRVLYKPHPLTGTRDSRALKAHNEIVALIEEANRQREAGGGWAREAAAGATARDAAATEMTRTRERLRELSGEGKIVGSPAGRGGETDYAMLSRDSKPDPARDAEWQQAADAWHAAYWDSQGWWQHRVVTGPLPALYACFNRSDLLISDISSVVADFVATGKPYAVTNPDSHGDAEFRAEYPTAAAGYLLSRDCAELPEIIEQAASAGDDRLAAARQELKRYLLGPDSPPAQTRFAAAIEALISQVENAATAAGNSAAAVANSAAAADLAGPPAEAVQVPRDLAEAVDMTQDMAQDPETVGLARDPAEAPDLAGDPAGT